MWIFCRVFAILFQSVSNVISRPLAAVGDRFIVPSYPYISTKWRTEMCLRWNEYTYLMMWKYGFGKGKIRARWIGPYAWRCVSWVFWGVRWYFAGCKLGVFVGECGYSRNVCNVFILCTLHIRRTNAWFLQCKSMVFVFWMLCCCKLVARISWLNVDILRSVCHIIPIRQQRY